MGLIDVSIRVDGASRDVFDRVIQHLVAAGLMNVTTAKRLGLVDGSIDGSGMPSLRGIRGVESVHSSGQAAEGKDSRADNPRTLPPIEMPPTGNTIAVV